MHTGSNLTGPFCKCIQCAEQREGARQYAAWAAYPDEMAAASVAEAEARALLLTGERRLIDAQEQKAEIIRRMFP